MARVLHPAVAVSSLLLLLAGTGWAGAQSPYFPTRVGANPYQQPTLSPYLNLLRAGDPAANYYLLVRPEFRQRSLNAEFGSAILDLERRGPERPAVPADELVPALPSTGHAAVFVNTGGYFNSFGPAPRGGPAQPPANRGRP